MYIEFGLYIKNNPYFYDYDSLATDGYIFKENVVYLYQYIKLFDVI